LADFTLSIDKKMGRYFCIDASKVTYGSNGIANIDIMDDNRILGQDGFFVFLAPKIIDIGADQNVIMDLHKDEIYY